MIGRRGETTTAAVANHTCQHQSDCRSMYTPATSVVFLATVLEWTSYFLREREVVAEPLSPWCSGPRDGVCSRTHGALLPGTPAWFWGLRFPPAPSAGVHLHGDDLASHKYSGQLWWGDKRIAPTPNKSGHGVPGRAPPTKLRRVGRFVVRKKIAPGEDPVPRVLVVGHADSVEGPDALVSALATYLGNNAMRGAPEKGLGASFKSVGPGFAQDMVDAVICDGRPSSVRTAEVSARSKGPCSSSRPV
jgi:hypothetical protein